MIHHVVVVSQINSSYVYYLHHLLYTHYTQYLGYIEFLCYVHDPQYLHYIHFLRYAHYI